MQTFLPYADFEKSAAALDNKRLNKQIVEVQQIIKAIQDPDYGWQNHPAVNMWRGFEGALVHYGLYCYAEWLRRKDKYPANHKSGDFILDQMQTYGNKALEDLPLPPWVGRGDFHTSHQSNLIRKDADYYGQQFPGVPDDLEYVWPSKDII